MAEKENAEIEATDPYRWLEDNATPRVQDWLKAQQERTEEYFRQLPMRDGLRERFRQLFALDTVGMPYPYQGRYFTTRRSAGQDMHVLYVQDGLTGEPRVVLDPHTFSADKSVTLSSWAPSPDGGLLVYGLSQAGNDKRSLHVLNVLTGEKFADTIPDDFYPAFSAWNVDGTGFWYAKHDPRASMEEAKLHKRLYYHALGTAWPDDPVVFGEGRDKEDMVSGGPTEDGHYFLVTVYGQDKEAGREWNEVWLRDLRASDGAFTRIVDRRPGTYCTVSIHRDRLYFLSNQDAPRWRILELEIEAALAGGTAPRVLIPEGAGVIESHALVGDKLFVGTLEDVHTVLRQYDLGGRFVREVALPTLGSVGGFAYEEEGEELFFDFDSFAVPPTIYRLDLRTDGLAVFARAEAGFDTSRLVTEQVWYPSGDGTRIPMFLIHEQGLARDGDRPTVLCGYGGFDISLTPSFMKSVVPFLEHGGVYAIANLRGGGEFGAAWHEAGMKKNKQNVFDDFAAAARWLIDSGYTRRERLAIEGGSNGGLLTMATITQHPDLVAAAIAQVPVTDMLRYHLFFGGVYWIPDYGDPDDPDMRQYLLTYSPYHNVRDGEKYPATLISTSDNDDRVHPMHSYKMAARLQEANASEGPIYLRVELKAGHGGASAVSKYVEQAADEWSFIFDRLGIKW
ncbi:MAG: prolyl oligopeptidase family serine peptidase [Patescibacteria group bacterium]|jgi:prolyl oligopeptidase